MTTPATWLPATIDLAHNHPEIADLGWLHIAQGQVSNA